MLSEIIGTDTHQAYETSVLAEIAQQLQDVGTSMYKRLVYTRP